MLRDALLTLLWTNTGRQQHWLIPQRGELTSLLELFARVVGAEELVTIAISTGQPLASLNAPTAGLRVLITLGPSAERILSSGWWRPEAPGPWSAANAITFELGAVNVISASFNHAWVKLKVTSIFVIVAFDGMFEIANVLETPTELLSGIAKSIEPDAAELVTNALAIPPIPPEATKL